MLTNTLYEKDFYAWIYHNIELVQAKKWDEIDADLLIEELESMAKRDKHELVSHLTILLLHLLKWEYQFKQLSDMWQEFGGKSWKFSIIEQRKQIAKQLKMSPSLKTYLSQAIIEAYDDALELAVDETGLQSDTFPTQCPYTVEQLLDKQFYPQSQ